MAQLPINDLTSLIKVLHSGDLSLMTYLNKLEEYFKTQEPLISAFISEEGRFRRLYQEAKKVITNYSNPEIRPPLFGVPIGVKDIFHISDFSTHAGSKLPSEQLEGTEAECVSILKKAGALILGKTVTTEFAYLAPGPTKNPHNFDYTPGGSSSGSAAAVASGLCPLALGTQTVGSIIRPASFCGIVGYKPSYDRISRNGIIPLSPSVDTIGFFVSDVAGAKLVASLLCRDWKVEISKHKPVLGIPEGPYLKRTSREGLLHFHTNCKRLIGTGFEVKSVDAMQDFNEVSARHYLIVAAEAAQVHAKWFSRFGRLYRPETVKLIKKGQKVSKTSLTKALAGRKKLRTDLISLMDENGIDLWLSPSSTGPAPRGLESTGDPIMNLPWTHSGLPTINLPAGFNQQSLPIGLQLTGRWYADESLLEWVADIELSHETKHVGINTF